MTGGPRGPCGPLAAEPPPQQLEEAAVGIRVMRIEEPLSAGLNGRQLADAARVKRPRLKVLFVTGYAENAAGSSFLEPGMGMVAKPFTMDVLASKIREMIEDRPGENSAR
jgi:DNA-binding LytR/AlgR family response regulator